VVQLEYMEEKMQLADSIIKKYSLGNSIKCSLIEDGIENLNYLISTPKEKFVLRIYNSKRSIEEIKKELEVLEYLDFEGIPIPEIQNNLDDSPITTFNNRYAVLFYFVGGEHPKWKPIEVALSKDIGIQVAKLHKVLQNFNKDFKTKKMKTFLINLLKKVREQEDIKKYEKYIVEIQSKYRDESFRKSIIHGDISRENILIKGNKLNSFLDFDDMHKGLLIWDVAIAVTQLFITKSFGIDWRGLDAFLEGYNSILKLSEEEKDAIFDLLIIRNIEIALITAEKSSEKESDSLQSINQSVLKKIELIEENRERLREILVK